MGPDEKYRVTRDGKSVFEGDAEGLKRYAYDGQLMAKDLVYDPGNGKWSFAKSVRALAGIELGGRKIAARRTRAPLVMNIDEMGLRRTQRQRQNFMRGAFVLMLAGFTVIAVLLVPTERERSRQSLVSFADDVAKETFGTDTVLENPSSAVKGTANGLASGSAEGGGQPGGGGNDGPVGGGAAVLVDATQDNSGEGGVGANAESEVEVVLGVRQTANEPNNDGMMKGQVIPDAPGHLVVLLGDEAEGSDSAGPQQGLKLMGAALRAFNEIQGLREASPDGEQLRQILVARHRAMSAREALNQLDQAHPDLGVANQLVDDLSKEFERICAALEGKAFCGLKLEHPDWADAVVRKVEGGNAAVGMNHDQVRAAWGGASRIRREGESRRYCFDALCGKSVVFVGDVVVEVSDE